MFVGPIMHKSDPAEIDLVHVTWLALANFRQHHSGVISDVYLDVHMASLAKHASHFAPMDLQKWTCCLLHGLP